MIISVPVMAHQFTPTYPKFEQSYIPGIQITNMTLFNKRKDVNYYKVDVYDKSWEPVRFAAIDTIIKIDYLETKSFDVYASNKDVVDITYICTRSMISKEVKDNTVVSSRICSKVK